MIRIVVLVGAVAIAAAAPAQTLLERRSQQYEPQAPAAEIHLEGVDLSDAALVASARANCGPTQQCEGFYREKRDRVASMFAAEKGRRKTILKMLGEETVSGNTNWNMVEMRLSAKYDYLALPWRAFATCRTWTAGGTVSTTCYGR